MKPELLKALLEVQKELKSIAKGSQAYNYKYADLPTIWNAIRETIYKNGFVVTHEINEIGVKTTVIHESGELSSTIPFTTEGMKPQEIGSEITYYKRYNLSAIFNIIVEGEDDDAAVALESKIGASQATCEDCGSVKVMRKDGTGSYCKGRYTVPPTCPRKKPTESEQRIIDELK